MRSAGRWTDKDLPPSFALLVVFGMDFNVQSAFLTMKVVQIEQSLCEWTERLQIGNGNVLAIAAHGLNGQIVVGLERHSTETANDIDAFFR